MPAGLLNEATLSAYNPSWRDKLATWIMGNQKASPEKRQFVGGLLGSTGLGSTGASVSDFTPVGGLLGAQEAAQRGDMKGMALAALPMPAKSASGVLNAVEREAPHIIAYHGSPHSFDRFDLSKIGTGEGAQAYGHGLYFADSENVARSYRNALSNTVETPEGVDPLHKRVAQMALTFGDNTPEGAVAWLDKYKNGAGHVAPALTPEVAAAVRGAFERGEFKPGGSMYQVRINADPAHFLDWDKPLSEQSPVVRQSLEMVDPEIYHPSGGDYDANELGQSIYHRLMNNAVEYGIDSSKTGLTTLGGAQGKASSDLRDFGVPGIKYLDAGSRGAGEGSRNYVVFDDKLIDILKKYGLGGILGGGAAYGAMNGANQPSGPEL